jgi:uncharacterized membrane protein
MATQSSAKVRKSSYSKPVQLITADCKLLWLPYKPHAYWWKVVECIRRLALTGCLVFIAPGDPMQSAYACAFAVVTTVLYGMVAPLRSRTDSNSYWIGCALIFMTIFVALLLQAEYAQADQSTVGILTVLLVLEQRTATP